MKMVLCFAMVLTVVAGCASSTPKKMPAESPWQASHRLYHDHVCSSDLDCNQDRGEYCGWVHSSEPPTCRTSSQLPTTFQVPSSR
jgi:hypothetical protein